MSLHRQLPPRHSMNSTITTTLVTSIEQMNRRTELPTTKETTTDPTTIIMGTPFLVARKNYSDAVV